MFETMVGVELLEGYKRAVCDTRRSSIFGKNSMVNMSRLAISSASLNTFFLKLPVARAKQPG